MWVIGVIGCFIFFYEEYTARVFMKVLSNWSLKGEATQLSQKSFDIICCIWLIFKLRIASWFYFSKRIKSQLPSTNDSLDIDRQLLMLWVCYNDFFYIHT